MQVTVHHCESEASEWTHWSPGDDMWDDAAFRQSSLACFCTDVLIFDSLISQSVCKRVVILMWLGEVFTMQSAV